MSCSDTPARNCSPHGPSVGRDGRADKWRFCGVSPALPASVSFRCYALELEHPAAIEPSPDRSFSTLQNGLTT